MQLPDPDLLLSQDEVPGSLWNEDPELPPPLESSLRPSSPMQQPDPVPPPEPLQPPDPVPPPEPMQPPDLVQVDLSPEPSLAPVQGQPTLTQAAQMHEGNPPQVDNCPEGSAVKLHDDGLYYIFFPGGELVLIPEAASGWKLGWSSREKRVYYHKPGEEPRWEHPLKITPTRPRRFLRPNWERVQR